MKTSMESVQVEVNFDNKLTLSSKIIANLLRELKADYETALKIKSDFIYLMDRKRGSHLSVEPSKITISERKNLEQEDLRKSLNKVLNLCTDKETYEKLQIRISVKFNLRFKENASIEHITNFNSIITKLNIKPFALTGINFVTEEDNNMYEITVSYSPEGYDIGVKSVFIDYSRLETSIRHINESLITQIRDSFASIG